MESEIKLRFNHPSRLKQTVFEPWFRRFFETEHPTIIDLSNIYFDTSDYMLRSMGAVARVRTLNDNEIIHTLKISAGQVDGLHQRLEWNYNMDAHVFDAQAFLRSAQMPCDSIDQLESVLMPVAHTIMHPIFETRFERQIYIARYQSSRMEIALDVGDICVGNQKASICEMEIELIEGNLSDLIALGQVVLDHADCEIENESKYGRAINMMDKEFGS